ncbi:MAG: T9SS type A sorting domain-containing protein [Saprospiraceae bacterium]
MRSKKHLFNKWLRAYIKCRHKLTNLRLANRNHRRQSLLEKNIVRLHKKLTNLQAIFKRATLATSVVGALACMPQTSAAQTFAAPELNPFGLVRLGFMNAPDFADVDGDGDLDIITAGFYGEFVSLENTGTVSTPAFTSPITNPFGLTSTGNLNFPTFIDLDGDGDLDIITAGYYGDFLYFENTGTVSTPAFAALQSNPFGLTSTGRFNGPEFADLDDDGDFDMMTGGDDGIFLYFKNIGTATSPYFDAPETNPFGLSSTSILNIPTFVDLDKDGDLDIMSTEYYGPFLYFMNTGTALSPSYVSPLVDPFGLISTGNFNWITLGDLDGDGDYDILSADYYGFHDGNHLYFENTTPITAISPVSPGDDLGVMIYPNPNNGEFKIKVGSPAQIEIIDAIGSVVFSKEINEGAQTIKLDHDYNGIYIVKVIANERQTVHQVVINK